MVALTRAAGVCLTIVALCAAPFAGDWCVIACEASHAAAAGSAPACHHTTAAAAMRIGHAPAPCGHDHDGVTIAVPALNLPHGVSTSVLVVAPAAVAGASHLHLAVLASRAGPPPPQHTPALRLSLSSSLRI
jgi:hypothetical protein